MTAQVNFAFEWAVSRKPTDEERAIIVKLYQTNLADYQSDKLSAAKVLQTGHAPVDSELDVAELAAWTNVARALLNMSETITRN